MPTVRIPATPAIPSGAATDQGWYGAASAHVARFLHRLRCIPANMWMQAAEGERFDARPGSAGAPRGVITEQLLQEQADYAARSRLHDVMESMPVVVKRIRRRVDQDLAVLEGIVPAGAMRRMRRAAHLAAFGLAAQPALGPDDVARLYRPFEQLIPLAG
ncbi:MAG: hypothetical protein ACYC3Q_05215 [Gemmatimonadaceae bacterium]